MIYNLGELFAGPGGLALGALNAHFIHDGEEYGIETAWASDYDINACTTYLNNICPGAPEKVICKDVRNMNLELLEPINALAFGFPCNDFSIVGEQNGLNGNYGPLYTYGINIINLFNPHWFVAENVSGLKNANEGGAFTQILRDLQTAGNGYNIVPHLYKFEEYGIPQARHRIIIVGIRNDLGLTFNVPAPTNERISSREAIEIPAIPDNASNHELTRQSQTVIERLMHIRPGQNAFTANLPEHLQLNVKGAKISQIYKRLDPDKPSYTITGSGGGGTHVYHWIENRALTNRERARLQTFPDEFIFFGSKESVRKQIGMAVPPKGARIIFDAVLKTFAGIHYNGIVPNIQFERILPEIQ